MVTPTAIDLASGAATTDAFTVDEFLMTVQTSWTGLNGDFDVIPLQTNNGSVWNPIYDFKGNAIVWPVRFGPGLESGSKTFQIPDGLHAVTCKLKVAPVGGNFSATTGTVTLVVKNTETEA